MAAGLDQSHPLLGIVATWQWSIQLMSPAQERRVYFFFTSILILNGALEDAGEGDADVFEGFDQLSTAVGLPAGAAHAVAHGAHL